MWAWHKGVAVVDKVKNMSHQNVRKSLAKYKQLERTINERLEELELRRDALQSTLPTEEEEIILTSEIMVDDERRRRIIELKRERLKATDILLTILQLKMGFVSEAVTKLELLNEAKPKMVAPPELQVKRFHDWAETNQQLYQLNTQLYEIEQSKWRMEGAHRKREPPMDHSTVMASTHMTMQRDQSEPPFNLYICDRLCPRDNDHMTFEALKLQEYVNDCNLFQGGCLENPPRDAQGVIRGAHPLSYHAFVEILCNYIVERHRTSQGEELPYSSIYTAIEHNLMPSIKHLVLKYVQKKSEDDLLHLQCLKYADVTLSQLRVPLAFRSKELIPFADAIAHMKASYFSQSPTDKMHRVVAAAKALHNQLGSMMEEGHIDGDTFLDLWVYVCIKANMKDMATNVGLMSEYGNPQFSLAEAGYYLTTLHAAMSFISRLTPEQLQEQEENNSCFVMCEVDNAKLLTSSQGTCLSLLTDSLQLTGYKVGIITKWVLDRSRLFSTVLVHTSHPDDVVNVALVRLSSDNSTPQHVEYYYEKFTNQDISGVTCRGLQEGVAILADPEQCGKELVVVEKAEENISDILGKMIYAIQLVRLGSESIDNNTEMEVTSPLHASSPWWHSRSLKSYTVIGAKDDGELDDDDDVFEQSNRARFSLPANFSRSKLSGKKYSFNRNEQAYVTVTAEVYQSSFGSSRNSITVSDHERKDDCFVRPKQRLFSNETASIDEVVEVNLLSPAYVDVLENNFLENHLYGNKIHPIEENMIELIKQCQMLLQRLNYLSLIHPLDGIYDDVTLHAVQSFQVEHNKQDNFYCLQLPENGVLSVATFQYLRQELLTIFANLMRLQKDVGMDTLYNFNPLSTEPQDISSFTEVVKTFQHVLGIDDACCEGILCPSTVAHIKQLLSKRSRSMSNIDKRMTL